MSPVALAPPAAYATVSWTGYSQQPAGDREDYVIFASPRTAAILRSTNMSFVDARPDLETVRGTVRSYALLPEGWDTYGGRTPTAKAVLSAVALLDGIGAFRGSLPSDALLPFYTAPLSSGGLQLEWRNGGDALEVEISDDGTLNALFDRRAAAQRFEEHEGLSLEETLDLLKVFLGS